jgi:hypothetical protein
MTELTETPQRQSGDAVESGSDNGDIQPNAMVDRTAWTVF